MNSMIVAVFAIFAIAATNAGLIAPAPLVATGPVLAAHSVVGAPLSAGLVAAPLSAGLIASPLGLSRSVIATPHATVLSAPALAAAPIW